MCINCRHYARFLIGWKTFIVQCSHTRTALLSNRGARQPQASSGHLRFRSLPSLSREYFADVPNLATPFGQFVHEGECDALA
jgi:hypothetical protein